MEVIIGVFFNQLCLCPLKGEIPGSMEDQNRIHPDQCVTVYTQCTDTMYLSCDSGGILPISTLGSCRVFQYVLILNLLKVSLNCV